jgi:hypothetical protein
MLCATICEEAQYDKAFSLNAAHQHHDSLGKWRQSFQPLPLAIGVMTMDET